MFRKNQLNALSFVFEDTWGYFRYFERNKMLEHFKEVYSSNLAKPTRGRPSK